MSTPGGRLIGCPRKLGSGRTEGGREGKVGKKEWRDRERGREGMKEEGNKGEIISFFLHRKGYSWHATQCTLQYLGLEMSWTV